MGVVGNCPHRPSWWCLLKNGHINVQGFTLTATTSPAWVSYQEMADELGVAKKTINRLAVRGKLPEGSVLRIGHTVRVNREALLKHFAEQ